MLSPMNRTLLTAAAFGLAMVIGTVAVTIDAATREDWTWTAVAYLFDLATVVFVGDNLRRDAKDRRRHRRLVGQLREDT